MGFLWFTYVYEYGAELNLVLLEPFDGIFSIHWKILQLLTDNVLIN